MGSISNYMLKFTTYNCLLLILGMEVCNCQESPCPTVFRYEYDYSNNLYGVITVPTPRYHDNLILLNVELSIGNAVTSQNLDDQIQFLGTAEDVVNNYPLVFKLEFPPWNYNPPKIMHISINDQSLCVGEPVFQTDDVDVVTTLSLSYRLTVTTTFVNPEEHGNYGRNPNRNRGNKFNFPNKRKETTQLANNNFFTNYPHPNHFHPPVENVNHNSYDQRYNNRPVVTTTTTERTGQPPLSYHPDHQNSNSNPIATTSREPVKPVNTDNNFGNCGKPMSSNTLIANGNNVEMGAHPWAGALFLRQNSTNPKYLCGASLITKKLALTAGHCVSKYSPSDLYLIFGRININDWLDDNDQRTRVEKADIHPDYREETSDADIAILQFATELTFTSTVSPVCLWETESDLKNIVNETGVVVGWGQNENYQLSENLQELYIPVVSEETCLWASESFNNITSNRTFCAGKNDKSPSGPCNGDSGSGFYFNLNGRWTIRGIVSRSLIDLSGRCNLKQYAVYSDVAKYIQWIHTFTIL